MQQQQQQPRPFIGSGEVAELIGYTSAETFLRDRSRLEDDHLFPLPMPTHRSRALRWKRDEVQAWVARNGLPRATPGGNLHLLRLAASA